LLHKPCQPFSPPAPRFGIDGVSFRQVEQPLCFTLLLHHADFDFNVY
jgi:hypothetical protein